jgi:hypothetical protein
VGGSLRRVIICPDFLFRRVLPRRRRGVTRRFVFDNLVMRDHLVTRPSSTAARPGRTRGGFGRLTLALVNAILAVTITAQGNHNARNNPHGSIPVNLVYG